MNKQVKMTSKPCICYDFIYTECEAEHHTHRSVKKASYASTIPECECDEYQLCRHCRVATRKPKKTQATRRVLNATEQLMFTVVQNMQSAHAEHVRLEPERRKARKELLENRRIRKLHPEVAIQAASHPMAILNSEEGEEMLKEMGIEREVNQYRRYNRYVDSWEDM